MIAIAACGRSRSRVGNPRHLGCKLLIDLVGQIPDLPTSRLERFLSKADRGLDGGPHSVHHASGRFLMQTATASESRIHLHEPVESLLRMKGHAVWSISPEATVYKAIEKMSEKQIGAL